MLKHLLSLLITFTLLASHLYSYEVEFVGIDDPDTLSIVRCTSQLLLQKDSPAKTSAALKARIEEEISSLHKTLQSKGYYNATISADLSNDLITITIDPGPVYPFASFKVVPAKNSCATFPLDSILPREIGICIGSPAFPSLIIEAEDSLLGLLSRQGYPLATITCREVHADQSNQSIAVTLYVDTGPQATFGKTTIAGNDDILPIFFCQKIDWREGEIFNPQRLCRTLNALEESGLFSSINITYAEEALPDGSLPMTITVKEGKHRSIAFGVGYATDLGPGFTAEWEHRNMRSRGEKLRFLANIWQIKQEGFIKYIQPDCGRKRQDLIWQAEIEHEITKGFVESSFNLSATVERQVNDNLRISYGNMFSRLRNSHSNNNGDFNLFKTPLQAMWTHTNSLLDPTRGMGIHFKTIPTIQTIEPQCFYCSNTLTTTAYHSFDNEDRFVFAGKAVVGSIWGATDRGIPPSERFYAGSDTLLRGYQYMTVSPLGENNKPIGGRSMMIFSLESRMRVYEAFGVVLFYDAGNVYRSPSPRFDHKQLQSTGIGLRYHTPVGPLRLDVAFPLTPRRHLDAPFQLYFSVGQAF